MRRWLLIRDIILFFSGLAGVVYQLLGAKVVEPTLTVIFAAMMGLPAALWGDDVRRQKYLHDRVKEDDKKRQKKESE